MALASQLMADIGQLLGRRDTKKFADTAAFLSDNARLDAMHWSVSHQAYMDWGLHTDDVTLARPKAPPHAHPSHVPTEKVADSDEKALNLIFHSQVRQAHSDPQLGFVNALGYISLFPFILQVKFKASKTLDDIKCKSISTN